MAEITPADIEALLPQTQCGLCDFAGCKPYAKAILNGEAINKCLPGGVKVLTQLGTLLKQDVSLMLSDMQQKQKPALLAVIDESACIGCTKCIQACPVDAIIGAAKQMHTVINDECSGCELCIAPCPVDCISMIETNQDLYSKAEQFKKRFENKTERLEQLAFEKKRHHQQAKLKQQNREAVIYERKHEIEQALARIRLKQQAKR